MKRLGFVLVLLLSAALLLAQGAPQVKQYPVSGDEGIVGLGGGPTLGPREGLLAYWTFNGSVTTPPDSGYYGNDYLGALNWDKVGAGPASAAGLSGLGIQTVDTSNYFSIVGPQASSLLSALPSGFTVAGWCKRTGGSPVVLRVNYTPLVFSLNVGGGAAWSVAAYSTGAVNSTVAGAAANGNWQYAVGGYDAATKRVFVSVDGSAKGWAVVALDANLRPATDLVAGFSNNNGGLVDEVAIWNRVLSDAEISERYASGRGAFPPF
jgi:hypothetical protein